MVGTRSSKRRKTETEGGQVAFSPTPSGEASAAAAPAAAAAPTVAGGGGPHPSSDIQYEDIDEEFGYEKEEDLEDPPPDDDEEDEEEEVDESAAATSATSAGIGRKRKSRNPNDLPRPNRPLSAYFHFLADYRKQHAAKLKKKTVKEVAGMASQVWNDMSEDAKQPYFEMNREDRVRKSTVVHNSEKKLVDDGKEILKNIFD